jgi:hypothetical protein
MRVVAGVERFNANDHDMALQLWVDSSRRGRMFRDRGLPELGGVGHIEGEQNAQPGVSFVRSANRAAICFLRRSDP